MFLIIGHLLVCYVLCFCWVAELLVCSLNKLSFSSSYCPVLTSFPFCPCEDKKKKKIEKARVAANGRATPRGGTGLLWGARLACWGFVTPNKIII